jgi:ankyrin repeat protein
MAAVIGLRGLARGDDFKLSTNKADSGNFDDLVYTRGKTRYYLQLKHTDNPDITNLVPSDLVPLLLQCFESYFTIIQEDTFKELESAEFIIYTNKQLGPKLFPHKRQPRLIDVIFKTCDTGEIFNFTPDENEEIDVYTLVKNKVTENTEFDKLSPQEQDFKLKMIGKFLEKLIMVTGQKEHKEIDIVIIEEIRNLDEGTVKQEYVTVEQEEYERELPHFLTPLHFWWRKKKEEKEPMTPETLKKWLQEAKTKACTSFIRSLFDNCKQKIFRTGITFSNSEISQLLAELSKKRAIHLKSDALNLSSILLLDCLKASKCIFVTFESLQSNTMLPLHAWLGGDWEWLIVFCDSTVQQSDISDTCIKIFEIIKASHSTKRAIILTACSVQPLSNFVPKEHIFNFEQLSKETQDKLLDKHIDFQGCKVTMRSVLERHDNVQHVLGHELVTGLITDRNAVNIGGRLQVNEGYYAARELEMYIKLHLNVLQNSKDVFAVSGTTRQNLLKTVPSGKIVECVWEEGADLRDFTEDTSSRIFLLPDEGAKNSFIAIGEKLQGKTLHWVEFKNEDLLWKMSQGGTDSLLDYIDTEKTGADQRILAEFMNRGNREVNEDSILDLGVRTVLVVDEPGMGKSSTTRQVAWNTKLANNTSWVLHVNWNDHTGKLQDIDAAKFNFDSLFEFLCSTAFPNSKYPDINRKLLKHALQYSGNVIVLMDGFDEISPTHADKADAILSKLMKTEVKRVWVTSRPVEKERLERQLSVLSFSMKSLSQASQKEMLRKLWKYEADEKEEELNDFLRSVNQSVHDENFTGCPLYITMIATVYERDKETSLKSDGLWPDIDIVHLYEAFFDKKLHIYLTEKEKPDITKPSVLGSHKYRKQKLLEDFEKCALVAILPSDILKSLHDNEIEEEIQSFLEAVQAGEDKTGIVMNVVNGKPQFVHRTFAEFFTARWFSRKFKLNRSVLEDILFDRGYRFMRDVFDRMLAKDCPLHCAVLGKNVINFRKLLAEGNNVDAVDKGDRTVLHIDTDNITRYFTIHCTSKDGGSLDKTDCVLQWTPLQYAIKEGDWHTVESLLQSNVDRSGLDMIRPRAQDRDYIDPIIIQAATFGQVLLLEFLCGIGVNIHQASYGGFRSPLHAAVYREQLPAIRLLIQHGADCNTQYSDGQTLLFHAAARGSLNVVRALVEEGDASLDIIDVHGNTALDIAKKSEWYRYDPLEKPKIVQYLEEIVRKNHEGT